MWDPHVIRAYERPRPTCKGQWKLWLTRAFESLKNVLLVVVFHKPWLHGSYTASSSSHHTQLMELVASDVHLTRSNIPRKYIYRMIGIFDIPYRICYFCFHKRDVYPNMWGIFYLTNSWLFIVLLKNGTSCSDTVSKGLFHLWFQRYESWNCSFMSLFLTCKLYRKMYVKEIIWKDLNNIVQWKYVNVNMYCLCNRNWLIA